MPAITRRPQRGERLELRHPLVQPLALRLALRARFEMRLELETPAATLRTFANEDAPPQFLLGVAGAADPALVDRILAALQTLPVDRETASAFALPAACR